MITNLRETQGFIQSARQSGQDDAQILSRLIKSPTLDPKAKQVFEQSIGKRDPKQLLDFYSQVKTEPLYSKESLQVPGALGSVSRFLGSEKLGRRIGAGIMNFTDQDTIQALETASKNGFLSKEEFETIRTGGVDNMEALGSAVLTAASALLPGVSKGASFLGKTAKLAGTGAVFGGAGALEQTGNLEDIPRGVATGAVVAPLAVGAISGVGALGKFLFKTLPKNLLGALSGKGTTTFETALQRPEAARLGTKISDKNAGIIAKETRNAFYNLENKMSQGYEKSIQEVEKLYRKTNLTPKIGQGAVYQSNKTGETIKLTLTGIKKAISQKLRDFDVVVDPNDLRLNTSQSTIRQNEIGNVQQVFDAVRSWKDFSPVGLNRLATKISRFRRSGAASEQVNAIITSVKNSVREYVGDRFPEIQALNQEFFKRSQFLDTVDDLLKVGNKFEGEKGVMKTFGKIATLFDKNKDLARLVIQEFEKEASVDILGREAGRRLAQPTSVSSASLGGLVNTIFQTLFDPITKNIPIAAATYQQIKNSIMKNANKLSPDAVKQLLEMVDTAKKLAQQSKRIVGYDITKELSKE